MPACIGIAEIPAPKLGNQIEFSRYHHWAAEHFCILARRIEQAHNGKSRFSVQHRAYVTGSVLSSVAFLDALVSAFMAEISTGHNAAGYAKIPRRKQKKIRKAWAKKSVRFSRFDEKFTRCARILGITWKRGDHRHGDIRQLIRLRNRLTHHTPWTDWGELDKGLKKIQRRFAPNPMITTPNSNAFDKFMSAGCAEWAFESATAYADYFFEDVPVEQGYKKLRGNWAERPGVLSEALVARDGPVSDSAD